MAADTPGGVGARPMPELSSLPVTFPQAYNHTCEVLMGAYPQWEI